MLGGGESALKTKVLGDGEFLGKGEFLGMESAWGR